MVTLDVLVPMFNQAAKTVRLLGSIRETYNEARVILVDNASDPAELAQVEAALSGIPHRIIRNDENLGFVKAINQGIATSTAPFVCIQNNDTVMFEGGYRRLVAEAGGENVGVVGPVTSASDTAQSLRNIPDDWLDGLPRDEISPDVLTERFRGVTKKINMVAFFCTVIPRSTIEKVGYLSEEFGIGFGDDDDYCARCLAAGLRVLVALDVYVHHDHRTTFRSLYTEEEIDEMGTRNLLIFKAKHGLS